jgi:hypothetical protein
LASSIGRYDLQTTARSETGGTVDGFRTDQPWVDSADSSTEVPSETAKRRRWPVVVTSLLVIVVAIGVAGYVAASHYQPLAENLEGSFGTQLLASNGSLAASRVGTNQNMIWTEPAGSFQVAVIVSLNNTQRFGVTIDRVLAPANPSGTSNVHVYFDSKGSDEGFYSYKGGPAFTPSSLPRGGSLTLVIHWNQQCVPSSAQAAATKYFVLPVVYSFLGFRHTVNVPIEPVTIDPRSTC